MWRCKRRPRCGRFSSLCSRGSVIVLRCLAVGGFGSFQRTDPSKLFVRGRGGGKIASLPSSYLKIGWAESTHPFDRTTGFQHDGHRYVARGVSEKTVTLVVPIGRASSSVKPTKVSPSHGWMETVQLMCKILTIVEIHAPVSIIAWLVQLAG